jgi:outer membrane murein-binding lipoprotein Lpp
MQGLISKNQEVRKLYADATKKIGKLENDPNAAEAALQASGREADQAHAKTDHAVT